MYYEVKKLLQNKESDFPILEIEYFEKKEEAITYFENNKKNKDVLFADVEKITKSTKKVIRSYKK